jgi:hypothetical protein
MTPWRERALRWTAEMEDDLGDSGTLQVFVPSIMGAGILVSLAVLVADLFRVLNPRANPARRRALMRRRALPLVVPLAAALGLPAPELPRLRRRLRSRRFYLALFAVSVTLSLYVAIGSTANYLRAGGYVEGVLWLEVVAMSASLFFLGVGVAAVAVALRYPLAPGWARAVVDHSPLGALEP